MEKGRQVMNRGNGNRRKETEMLEKKILKMFSKETKGRSTRGDKGTQV